jgi:hypothetical protein
MKPKSDYAFVTGSSNAYSFGLISTMNAQNYFKTGADWEIVYDDYWNFEHLAKLSQAFPFNVTLHAQKPLNDELMNILIDKRNNKNIPFDPWASYSFLAYKLLKEKKYKAICVLQADQFVFVNLDTYFRIAENGVLVTGEFPWSVVNVDEMPFGNDKGIWNRCMCGAFDSINFYGQMHAVHFIDLLNFQLEEPFKDESSHPMICHNRSICKNFDKNHVLGLDKELWVADNIWTNTKLNLTGDKILNDCGCRINGWHSRIWEIGRISNEWEKNKDILTRDCKNPGTILVFDRLEHNYNLVKSFMERFNNMIPEIRADNYQKGFIKRPRYELGEK